MHLIMADNDGILKHEIDKSEQYKCIYEFKWVICDKTLMTKPDENIIV